MSAVVEYVPDCEVDAALDRALRDLLSACFTKPGDEVFRERRYFREPYPHRWLIRDPAGRPIAHLGVHEKSVVADARTLRIGGVGDVCVHPAHRGQGHVRRMLEAAHVWMAPRGFVFAVLFGDPAVYGSAGYTSVRNLEGEDPATGRRGSLEAMMRPLGETPWPACAVRLVGSTF